jgi:hypothetical protein
MLAVAEDSKKRWTYCDLDVVGSGRGVDGRDIGDASVVVDLEVGIGIGGRGVVDASVMVEVGIGIVVDIRLDRVITSWIMLAKEACWSTATQSIELRNCFSGMNH